LRLRLNADLVTLSIGDKGVGLVGEVGVENIVKTFIEAGFRSILSTVWELQDRAAAELMSDFHAHRGCGREKGALREAQLTMLNSSVPLRFWAGFELDGEVDSAAAGVCAYASGAQEDSTTAMP
jgi:CHAT domain-containing protein